MGTVSEMLAAERKAEEDPKAPYRERMASAQQRRDDWSRRWYLSLAVGNGAGGVGLTSAVVNLAGKADSPSPLLLIPGLWCFALGLVSAGVIPLLHTFRSERERQHAEIGYFTFWHGQTALYYATEDDVEDADAALVKVWTSKRTFDTAIDVAQAIAAVSFAMGLALPLACLTGWYIINHH